MQNQGKTKEKAKVEEPKQWVEIASKFPPMEPASEPKAQPPTCSNTPSKEDMQEQKEREKCTQNLVIHGLLEVEKESPLTLAKNVAGFFAQHFVIPSVVVYGAHRVGRMQEGMANKRAIVCTVMDARKRAIILDSSRIYLKSSPYYVSEDHTSKQQEARRKRYAKRQMRQDKMSPTQESNQDAQ